MDSKRLAFSLHKGSNGYSCFIIVPFSFFISYLTFILKVGNFHHISTAGIFLYRQNCMTNFLSLKKTCALLKKLYLTIFSCKQIWQELENLSFFFLTCFLFIFQKCYSLADVSVGSWSYSGSTNERHFGIQNSKETLN